LYFVPKFLADVALLPVLLIADCRAGGTTEGSANQCSASSIAVSKVVSEGGPGGSAEHGPTESSKLGVRSCSAACEEEGCGCGQTGQQFDFHVIALINSTA
jgi:hypothetical protein